MKSKYVSFYFSDEFLKTTYAKFKELCRREDKTASRKIRELIENYVRDHYPGNPQTSLKEQYADDLVSLLETIASLRRDSLRGDRIEALAKYFKYHPEGVNLNVLVSRLCNLWHSKRETVLDYIRVLEMGNRIKIEGLKIYPMED